MSRDNYSLAENSLAAEQGQKLTPLFRPEYYEVDSELGDEIHLREYLYRIWPHKWIVAITTLVLTTAAAAYLFTMPDVFQAETVIQVDSDDGSLGTEKVKTAVSPFEDRAYYNTQLELLESRELVRTVIKKLDLENNPDFLTPTVLSQMPSQTALLFTTPPSDLNGVASSAGPADLETRKLDGIIDAMVDLLSIQPVVETKQNVKDTRLISVRFKHSDPTIASTVSNAVGDQLVAVNLATKLQSNSNENKYLQDNITSLQEQVRRDEERLLQFGRNYQLPSPDDKQNTVAERLAGLNQQLLEAEDERKKAESAYQAAMAPGAANSLAEMDAKQIADIDGKLDDLRQRRAQLLVEVTEKYPDVREIDKQIGVLEKAATDKREKATSIFKTNLDVHYRAALAREQAVRKSFDDQWEKSLDQNAAAINYRIIQQDLDTNRKMLDDMQQREKQNELLKAKAPNNIRIVDYAATPTEPLDQKKKPLLGLAFLLSFCAGIGGALLRDYFDESVHSTDEVEKTLSLPALASIPQIKGSNLGIRRWLSSAHRSPLTVSGHLFTDVPDGTNGKPLTRGYSPPLAEAFRRLRTVLLLSPEIGKIKKLLVTSNRQGEGKTTTAVNIATSLADTGATVLVIDADLHRPQLHKIFNLPEQQGLSDFLTEDVGQEEVFNALVKRRENFYLLPAGKLRVDGAEFLGSARMRDLLDQMSDFFDFIVIDSTPVSAFADAAILATMADGVLLVVQENRNTAEDLRQARKLLDLVAANIVGVVLNKVTASVAKYDYHRYQNPSR